MVNRLYKLLVGCSFLLITLFSHRVFAVNNLFVHLPLDEGNNKSESINYAGSTSPAILHNGVSWVDGKFGQALYFDGINQQYAEVPNPVTENLNPEYITVSVWIKPVSGQQFSGNQFIVSKHRDCCDATSKGGYGLGMASGKLRGEVLLENASGNGRLRVESSVALGADVWTHVAMTFDGTNLKLYINGNLDNTVISEIPNDKIKSNTKKLIIGALSYNVPNYQLFKGAIDEVRIYDRALNDTEINELYLAVGGDPQLLFYESFDSAGSISANQGPDQNDINYTLEVGRSGNALRVNSVTDLFSYPAIGNYDKEKGAISFWIKPEWAGDDDQTYSLLQIGTGQSRFRVLKYYGDNNNNGIYRNYFSFTQYSSTNCGGSCFRGLDSYKQEPNTSSHWQPNEWHFIEVSWDYTAAEPYVFYLVDGQVKYKNDPRGWDMSNFTPDNIYIGSTSEGIQKANALIDDLRIYASPRFELTKSDMVETIGTYKNLTVGDGVWQKYETVHESVADSPILDSNISPEEDYLFYQAPPFSAVYEGTVPDVEEITDSITIQAAADQFEPIFFNIYSRIALDDVNVSVSSLTTDSNDIIPAENVELKVIKNWFQSGTTPNYSFSFHYVPELLLSDDQVQIEGLTWSRDTLPTLRLTGDVSTALRAYTSKAFIATVELPKGLTPGLYSGDITVTTPSASTKTLSIKIDVQDFDLAEADKDLIIYHQARYDDASKEDYMSYDRYFSQLTDIKEHGFNSVIFYGKDVDYLQDAISAGLTRKNVSIGGTKSQMQALASVFEDNGLEPYFYGVDEPDSNVDLVQHINKSKLIHEEIGGKVITAITKPEAESLSDFNDPIYSYTGENPSLDTPVTVQPLDYANFPVNKTQDYIESVLSGDIEKDADQEQGYYWQIMQENPVINRFHAGFYLWNTGLDGIVPYVYQSIWNDPYNDFDVWGDKPASNYRDHMVAYPSENGPVPTVQWEALREGIDDYRYVKTWAEYNIHAENIGMDVIAIGNEMADLLNRYSDYSTYLDIPIEQFTNDRAIVIAQINTFKDYIEINDVDLDQVENTVDNCPTISNSDQLDSDNDNVGDVCDAFPNDPNETVDTDGDGVGDNSDAFPNDPAETVDTDGDGVGNNSDNCQNESNPNQEDTDGDNIGNVCDDTPNGDITLTGYPYREWFFKSFAQLSWTGAESSWVDVYRNGNLVATTENDGDYTYESGWFNPASGIYQVCQASSTILCSNEIVIN